PGWSWWGIGLFILFQLIVRLADFSGANPDLRSIPVPAATAGPTLVGDQGRDIDLALLTFADGFTLARARRENQKLVGVLVANWEVAQAGELTVTQFVSQTEDLLFERFRGAMVKAPYAPLAAYRRLRLGELDRARAISPA